MAGRGPAPSDARRRANAPERGDWTPPAGIGWQHSEEIPPCPARSPRARRTWSLWMGAWYAANWDPEDLPVLELTIKLWAKADSGKATGSERSELRQLMDSCGITKKGQQDRRWKAPAIEEPDTDEQLGDVADEAYGHLRAIPGGA